MGDPRNMVDGGDRNEIGRGVLKKDINSQQQFSEEEEKNLRA